MSLDQTFLKIFGEEEKIEPKSKPAEAPGHFSLRVEMNPPSDGAKNSVRTNSPVGRDVISFEEETRLRFPEKAEEEEIGDFVYFGDADFSSDDESDAFTVVPEPSLRFRRRFAEKKRRENSTPFFFNKETAETDSPIISLFSDGRGKSIDKTPEERPILRMDDAVPREEISASSMAETPMKTVSGENFPAEEKAEEKTIESGNIDEVCQTIPLRRGSDAAALTEPFPVAETAGAETLLASAAPKFLTGWPKPFDRLRSRGSREFSLLADAVAESMFRGNKILGFGGWGHQTGVSTLLLGIAGEMTARRFSVLVVDADFQRPGLAAMLGMNVTGGWENLLRYPESVSQSGLLRVEIAGSDRSAHRKTGDREGQTGETFHLLPLRPETVTDAVAASCKKIWFRTILELAELFDLVLIDHGSLKTENDREKVSELLRFGCDGYYLVADRRSAPDPENLELTSLSEERRLPCLGIIENFT